MRQSVIKVTFLATAIISMGGWLCIGSWDKVAGRQALNFEARFLSPTKKREIRRKTIGDRESWRAIDNPLGYIHRRQWSGRARHEVRVPPHRRREHHKGNNYNRETTHALT